MAEITQLRADITANSKPFVQEITKAETAAIKFANNTTKSMSQVDKGVNSLADSFRALAGVLSISAIGAMIKGFGDLGDQAAKIGVNVVAFQNLAQVAREANVNTDSLQMSMFKLQKIVGEAARGNKEAAQSLAAIGLNAKQLQGLSIDEQFIRVGEAIGKINDQSIKASVAGGIFGRGAAEVMGIFQANLRESVNEMERLNVALGADQIARLDSLADKAGRFLTILKTGAGQLLAIYQPFGDFLLNIAGSFVSTLAAGAKYLQASVGDNWVQNVANSMANLASPITGVKFGSSIDANSISPGVQLQQAETGNTFGGQRDNFIFLTALKSAADGAAVGVTAMANAATKAADSLTSGMLKSWKEGQTKDELQRVLGDKLKNPWELSADQKALNQSYIDQVKRANPGKYTDQQLAEMAPYQSQRPLTDVYDQKLQQAFDIIQKQGSYKEVMNLLDSATGDAKSFGMLGAISDLRKFANESNLAGADQREITIKIQGDGSWVVSQIKSPPGFKVLTDAVKDITAKEAASLGSIS